MASKPTPQRFTYEEYLAREEASQTKHEFRGGEIIAMAGGTPEHGALAMAFGALLSTAISDRPCRVFSSDVKVLVEATGLATYPDVSGVCGALVTSATDGKAVTNPVVLVEVLSPGTEAYDRGARFGHYRHLPSLREIVFVNHESHLVEVHRRNEAGRFELYVFEADAVLELTSVGARIPVGKIYENRLTAG